jgi:hypothetical protein
MSVVLFDPGDSVPIRAGNGKPQGVTLAHLQAARRQTVATALPERRAVVDLLRKFQDAYGTCGHKRLIVGVVEAGTVFKASDWMPEMSCGLRRLGGVALTGEGGLRLRFEFLLVRGIPEDSSRPAGERLWELCAEAGAKLPGTVAQALCVAREEDPAGLWLTLVVTLLGSTPYVLEGENCVLLPNPFAASVRVLEQFPESVADERARKADAAAGAAVVNPVGTGSPAQSERAPEAPKPGAPAAARAQSSGSYRSGSNRWKYFS